MVWISDIWDELQKRSRIRIWLTWSSCLREKLWWGRWSIWWINISESVPQLIWWRIRYAMCWTAWWLQRTSRRRWTMGWSSQCNRVWSSLQSSTLWRAQVISQRLKLTSKRSKFLLKARLSHQDESQGRREARKVNKKQRQPMWIQRQPQMSRMTQHTSVAFKTCCSNQLTITWHLIAQSSSRSLRLPSASALQSLQTSTA